jgi:hypothetical protein
VIELILRPRRLRASRCPEFIPVFGQTSDHSWVIDEGQTAALNADKLKSKGDYLHIVGVNRPHASIIYLPVMVNMLCFICIPLKKIVASPHTQEYGCFGLVFCEKFHKRIGTRPVAYYTEADVRNDRLIKKYNELAATQSTKLKTLEREIVYFRKPAKLFRSFRESAITNIENTGGEIKVEQLTYDRYLEGYDFSQENEWRAVVEDDKEYVEFDACDLYQILVPNIGVKSRVEEFLRQCWKIKPKVEMCPQKPNRVAGGV